MPPTIWDVQTFERQQRDIEEIDYALPLLAAEQSDLQQQQTLLSRDCAAGKDVTQAQRLVSEKLARNAAQRRGRLLLAKACEEKLRQMLEDVSMEFLIRAEREALGGLRLKLGRILFQYGKPCPLDFGLGSWESLPNGSGASAGR